VGIGVGPPRRRRVRSLPQPVPGEVAQRLQEPVAHASVRLGGDDHRLVDQGGQQHRRVRPFEIVRLGAHVLGAGQVEAAREHAQAREQHPHRGGEEIVGPAHDVEQGAVARVEWPGSGQQAEPGVEPVRNVGRGHGPHPGRGQLEGERNPVEPDADHGDGSAAALVEDESGSGRTGTRRKEGDRGTGAHLGECGGARGRDVEWRQGPGRLTR
jgi:hypothetical protein